MPALAEKAVEVVAAREPEVAACWTGEPGVAEWPEAAGEPEVAVGCPIARLAKPHLPETRHN